MEARDGAVIRSLAEWGIQIGLLTFVVLSLLIIFQWMRLRFIKPGYGRQGSLILDVSPITPSRNTGPGRAAALGLISDRPPLRSNPFNTGLSSPSSSIMTGPASLVEGLPVFTLERLIIYNGSEKDEIYIALCGKVFDVTPSERLYGPGQPYHALAGHDAAFALARRSLKIADITSSSTDELSREEQKRLEMWKQTFERRYQVVAYLDTHPLARKRKFN